MIHEESISVPLICSQRHTAALRIGARGVAAEGIDGARIVHF